MPLSNHMNYRDFQLSLVIAACMTGEAFSRDLFLFVKFTYCLMYILSSLSLLQVSLVCHFLGQTLFCGSKSKEHPDWSFVFAFSHHSACSIPGHWWRTGSYTKLLGLFFSRFHNVQTIIDKMGRHITYSCILFGASIWESTLHSIPLPPPRFI